MNRTKAITFAGKDFEQVKKMMQIFMKPGNTNCQRLHADYYLGQVKCLNQNIMIEIIDLTSIKRGIWLQIRDSHSHKVLQSRSCAHHVNYIYINSLIDQLKNYKSKDVLASRLQLRPFGNAYEYKKRLTQ